MTGGKEFALMAKWASGRKVQLGRCRKERALLKIARKYNRETERLGDADAPHIYVTPIFRQT